MVIMASDAEAPAEEVNVCKTVTKYNVYCPCNETCKKGNRTLGSYWTEAKARDAVFTHLTQSCYHLMDEETAKDWADRVEVSAYTYEQETQEDALTSRDPRQSTRAKTRPRPSEPDEPPRQRRRTENRSAGSGAGSGGGKGGGRSAASGSTAVVVAARQLLQDEAHMQTRMAVSAARALARGQNALRVAENMARRAMEAFQDMLRLLSWIFSGFLGFL